MRDYALDSKLGIRMKRINARRALRERAITAKLIYQVMLALFPKKNDFGDASYEELITELNSYGIMTVGQFTGLMKKHRRALITLDQANLSSAERRLYPQLYPPEHVADSIRRRYWYAYPALVRTAAEYEFGEIAEVWEAETA